jgi:hypothetical protein
MDIPLRIVMPMVILRKKRFDKSSESDKIPFTMKTYLHSLIDQIEAAGIDENSDLTIQTGDGVPATVVEKYAVSRSEYSVRFFVQNADLTKLDLVGQ